MGFDFDKLSILVVEDTIPMRELFASILGSLGIRDISLASNGQEAFESFKKHNQDIVFTDWLMDPVDGLELTHEIRTNTLSPNRMVPIILITGYSAWSRVEKARDTGVTEFLIKPFTANDIARRLAHVITHPRQYIEVEKFFGPDRRRKTDPSYSGPLRRLEDEKAYDPNELKKRGKK